MSAHPDRRRWTSTLRDIGRRLAGTRATRWPARVMVVLAVLVTLSTSEPAQAAGESSWTPSSNAPTARFGAALAPDAAGHTVLFGGIDSADRDDTWVFDGSTWVARTPATSPPRRAWSATGYDPIRHVTVVFGGYSYSRSSPYADTWLWDGAAWSSLVATAAPPSRYGATLSWSPARRQLVLFGGADFNGVLADTWAFTGASWERVFTPHAPPAREHAAAAADPASGKIVVFGGASPNGFLRDTWLFDGNDWATATAPPPTGLTSRYGAAAAADLGFGRIVMHGGTDNGSVFGDSYAFDGSRWTALSVSNPAPARYYGAMTTGPDGHALLTTGSDGDHFPLADSLTFSPPDATTPGAPTGVTAHPDRGTVTVAWAVPASDGNSPITEYRIVSSPESRTVVVPGSARSVVLSDLRMGKRYTFTVTAVNAVGAGPASTPSGVVHVTNRP